MSLLKTLSGKTVKVTRVSELMLTPLTTSLPMLTLWTMLNKSQTTLVHYFP